MLKSLDAKVFISFLISLCESATSHFTCNRGQLHLIIFFNLSNSSLNLTEALVDTQTSSHEHRHLVRLLSCAENSEQVTGTRTYHLFYWGRLQLKIPLSTQAAFILHLHHVDLRLHVTIEVRLCDTFVIAQLAEKLPNAWNIVIIIEIITPKADSSDHGYEWLFLLQNQFSGTNFLLLTMSHLTWTVIHTDRSGDFLTLIWIKFLLEVACRRN